MKAMICTQCGGRINPAKMRCEYCGTCYEQRDKQIIRIETFQSHPVTLQASVSFGREYFDVIGAADMSKEICGRMARDIADELTKYIEYRVQEDPCMGIVTARGRVRVLPPDYKF